MKWFRHLKIFHKMFLSLGVTLIALIVLSGMSFYFMKYMANATVSMYENELIPIETLQSMRANLNAIKGETNALILSKDPNLQKQLQERVNGLAKANEELYARFEETSMDRFEKEHYATIQNLLDTYQKARGEAISLAMKGKNEEAAAYMREQVDPTFMQIVKELKEVAAHNSESAKAASADNSKDAANFTLYTLIIAGVAILLSISLSLFITRRITKPIQEMQQLMEQAEKGDLTVEGSYQSKDEIGLLTNSFNHMVSGFHTLINNLSQTSDSLYANADHLTASAEQGSQTTESVTNHMQQIAIGAESQRRQVQETSAAIEEMSASIVTVANRSKEANQLSQQAAQQTVEGNKVVVQVVNRMQSMSEVVQDSSVLVGRMRDRSKDIESIVNAITAISSQTNLLALNASIEAARAGEAGKGFAVVADEVRQLAEQTAASAYEITQLIAQINEESMRSVSAMDRVNEEVTGSMEGIEQIGELFASISHAVADVTAKVQEVSGTIQELSVGSEQVAAASSEISAISEQSTGMIQSVAAATEEQLASVEEIANSAIRLQGMAQELKDVVAAFKLA